MTPAEINLLQAIEKKAKELFSQVDPHAEIHVEVVYDVVICAVWPEDAGAKRTEREKYYDQEFNLMQAFSGAPIDFRYVEARDDGP